MKIGKHQKLYWRKYLMICYEKKMIKKLLKFFIISMKTYDNEKIVANFYIVKKFVENFRLEKLKLSFTLFIDIDWEKVMEIKERKTDLNIWQIFEFLLKQSDWIGKRAINGKILYTKKV